MQNGDALRPRLQAHPEKPHTGLLDRLAFGCSLGLKDFTILPLAYVPMCHCAGRFSTFVGPNAGHAPSTDQVNLGRFTVNHIVLSLFGLGSRELGATHPPTARFRPWSCATREVSHCRYRMKRHPVDSVSLLSLS